MMTSDFKMDVIKVKISDCREFSLRETVPVSQMVV